MVWRNRWRYSVLQLVEISYQREDFRLSESGFSAKLRGYPQVRIRITLMASASTINQPKLLSCASQYTVDDQQIFTNDFVWLVCPVCSLEAMFDIFKPQ